MWPWRCGAKLAACFTRLVRPTAGNDPVRGITQTGCATQCLSSICGRCLSRSKRVSVLLQSCFVWLLDCCVGAGAYHCIAAFVIMCHCTLVTLRIPCLLQVPWENET